MLDCGLGYDQLQYFDPPKVGYSLNEVLNLEPESTLNCPDLMEAPPPEATLSHLVIRPPLAPCLQALSRALFRPSPQAVLFILLSPEVVYAWTPAFSLNLFLLYKPTPYLDLSPLVDQN